MATNNKYDRQLRLWGSSGQKALSETCVVLFRATAAGTETLKNLILPGIGSFVIVDDVMIGASTKENSTRSTTNNPHDNIECHEYQSNFFLIALSDPTKTMSSSLEVKLNEDDDTNMNRTTKSRNISRAQMACEYLQELNPDVEGFWDHIIDGKCDTYGVGYGDNGNSGLQQLDFHKFLQTLHVNSHNKTTTKSSEASTTANTKRVVVIASDMEPMLLEKLSIACNDEQIPLVCVFSYGLLGIVRIQTPTLALMDTKPRDSTPDLRLRYPFPALQELYHTDIVLPIQQLQKQSEEHEQLNSNQNNTGTTTEENLHDWSVLDSMKHGHIPYPFILLRALKQWNDRHRSNRVPVTIAEKQEFQSMIQQSSRNYATELNFQEAVRNAYLAYAPRPLDLDHLQSLLNEISKACACSNDNQDATAKSSANDSLRKFYVMLRALDQFLKKRPPEVRMYQPPLAGTIPDMTSSTELYVKLQNTYKEQSHCDFIEMKSYVMAIEEEGESEAKTNVSTNVKITDDELLTFCQNVNNLDILQTGTIHDEYAGLEKHIIEDYENTNNDHFNEICDTLCMSLMEGEIEQMEQSPLLWFLGFRACQLFFLEHGRYPGVVDDYNSSASDNTTYENDIEPLQTLMHNVVQYYKLQDNDIIQATLLKRHCSDDSLTMTDSSNANNSTNDYAHELVRFGNAEVHAIASIVGGIASQEAVKIISGQYIPLNNTYVYNGIASIGSVYKL